MAKLSNIYREIDASKISSHSISDLYIKEEGSDEYIPLALLRFEQTVSGSTFFATPSTMKELVAFLSSSSKAGYYPESEGDITEVDLSKLSFYVATTKAPSSFETTEQIDFSSLDKNDYGYETIDVIEHYGLTENNFGTKKDVKMKPSSSGKYFLVRFNGEDEYVYVNKSEIECRNIYGESKIFDINNLLDTDALYVDGREINSIFKETFDIDYLLSWDRLVVGDDGKTVTQKRVRPNGDTDTSKPEIDLSVYNKMQTIPLDIQIYRAQIRRTQYRYAEHGDYLKLQLDGKEEMFKIDDLTTDGSTPISRDNLSSYVGQRLKMRGTYVEFDPLTYDQIFLRYEVDSIPDYAPETDGDFIRVRIQGQDEEKYVKISDLRTASGEKISSLEDHIGEELIVQGVGPIAEPLTEDQYENKFVEIEVPKSEIVETVETDGRYFSLQTPIQIDVPGESEKVSKIRVQNFEMKADGDYVRVRVRGNDTIVKVEDVYDENNNQISRADFDTYIGKTIKVKIGEEILDAEFSLIFDKIATYSSMFSYQRTTAPEDVMADNAYLRLVNGDLIKETEIEPVSYKFTTNTTAFDAFMVRVQSDAGARSVIVGKDIKIDQRTGEFTLEGQTYNINDPDVVTRLARSGLDGCDVIQTTTKKGNGQECAVLAGLESEARDELEKQTYADFISNYKSGEYSLEDQFVDDKTIKIRPIDAREIYTDIRLREDVAINTAEYRALNNKPLKVEFKDGIPQFVLGGPKYNIGKGISKGFSTWSKLLGVGVSTMFNGSGILLALAAAPVVAAYGIGMALAIPGIPLYNLAYGVYKNSIRPHFTEKSYKNKTEWAKQTVGELDNLYKQTSEHVQGLSHDATIHASELDATRRIFESEFERIFAQTFDLSESAGTEPLKFNAEGEIEYTADNAHYVSLIRSECKSQIKTIKKNSKKIEKEKAKYEKMKAEIASFDSKRDIFGNLSSKDQARLRSLQEKVAKYEIYVQTVATAKKEIVDIVNAQAGVKNSRKHEQQQELQKRAQIMRKFVHLKHFTSTKEVEEMLAEAGLDADKIEKVVAMLSSLEYDISKNSLKYKGKDFSLETGKKKVGNDIVAEEIVIQQQEVKVAEEYIAHIIALLDTFEIKPEVKKEHKKKRKQYIAPELEVLPKENELDRERKLYVAPELEIVHDAITVEPEINPVEPKVTGEGLEAIEEPFNRRAHEIERKGERIPNEPNNSGEATTEAGNGLVAVEEPFNRWAHEIERKGERIPNEPNNSGEATTEAGNGLVAVEEPFNRWAHEIERKGERIPDEKEDKEEPQFELDPKTKKSIEELEKLAQELEGVVSGDIADIKDLISQWNTISREIQELKQVNIKTKEERDALIEKVESLKRELEELYSKFDKMKNAQFVEVEEFNIEELKQTIEERTQEIHKLIEEINKLGENIKENKALIEEKKKELITLKSEIQTSIANLRAMQSMVEMYINRIKASGVKESETLDKLTERKKQISKILLGYKKIEKEIDVAVETPKQTEKRLSKKKLEHLIQVMKLFNGCIKTGDTASIIDLFRRDAELSGLKDLEDIIAYINDNIWLLDQAKLKHNKKAYGDRWKEIDKVRAEYEKSSLKTARQIVDNTKSDAHIV